MENASKALIIAAAVLIAILIIAMGVAIFNKAQNAADFTNLDQTEINMFNQKFERYAQNQLGSQVKSLISFAISNASTNKDEPSQLPTVSLVNQPSTSLTPAEGGEKAYKNNKNYIDSLTAIRNKLISTHTYHVTLGYGSSGLINNITIDYNT